MPMPRSWRAAAAELADGAGESWCWLGGMESLERQGLAGGLGTTERAVAPTQSRGPSAQQDGLGQRARATRRPSPSMIPRLRLQRQGRLPHLQWVCLLKLVTISFSLTWKHHRVGMSRCTLVQKIAELKY